MKTIGRTFPQENLYHCPYCDKAYKTEENLNKHIAEKHGDKNDNNAEE